MSIPVEVIERVTTARGELVLRRGGEHYEVISNGTFLMDTRDGRSERLLARAALEAHPGPARVLIGGLGVGFTLVETLTDARVDHITVVEIEPALVEWHHRHLSRLTGAALADRRTDVVVDDFARFVGITDRRFDVICLDIDNGPDWTVTEGNAQTYSAEGTRSLLRLLNPGGILAVWSAAPSPEYEELLRANAIDVDVREVPVRRGAPDVVYLAHAE
jgi:spermidine synthase